MLEKLQTYYLTKAEPAKSCLYALRAIILNQDSNISETFKYGMPCFCYNRKIICYLWTDKKSDEPYILWADGKYLNNPELETGNRSRMKLLRVNPAKDLPLDSITTILCKALALHQ
ncbi:DUF1801 domain-containing protein [Flavihumibacter sp. CACIAM 22H1]|uniref:DUF1801 domain-containing protein n=1 Tax=Flavihumibacter sp. CACIAM 22H1 TaxID=1812911 RepID=UPI0007A7E36F|nr:DUF1801 domain-containing protein [Flavihumibacter sp. CACIAM 22H1]KYP14261.1 MAG: hypothetical protein A1D16_17595 [Flavihumibacter sp. CACIAM 22H1]